MNPRDKWRLQAATTRIEHSEAAMEQLLKKLFPIGDDVRCYKFMHGQATPTVGTVIAHTGGRHAYLRLRLHTRTRVMRDVSARNVW